MTNKEAINILKSDKSPLSGQWGFMCGECPGNCEKCELNDALNLAIKALETLDDVSHKVYRNEHCDRAGKCIDYIGWHCAGCGGAT